MSDSLIQFPAMVRGASFAGTCLMQTMMFTACLLRFTKGPDSPAIVKRAGNGAGRESNFGAVSCAGGFTPTPPSPSGRLPLLSGDSAVLVPCPPLENQRGVGTAEPEGI